MFNTAIKTSPASHSKVCPTFRTALGYAPAARTNLGGEPFIDFLKPCPVPNGFVRERVAKERPACIENGLGHAGFGKSGGVDIPYRDVIKLTHDAGREFVVEVLASVGDLGVDSCSGSLFSGSLRDSKTAFEFSVLPFAGDLLARGKRGKVFQAKINANTGLDWSCLGLRNVDHDVQIPVAQSVLTEVCSVLDFAFRDSAGIEDAKGVAGKPESVALTFQITPFQRHPSERSLVAAPAKVRTIMLFSGLGILLANSVDSTGVQAKLLTAPSGQFVQIKPGRPAFVPLERLLLNVVAVIPNHVHSPRLLVQQTIERLYAVTVNEDHFSRSLRFRYSSTARRICSDIVIPVLSASARRRSRNCNGRNMLDRFIPADYTHITADFKRSTGTPALPPRPERRGFSRRIR
ncbi:hypothetical protein FV185_05900 [Ferrovum sp. PN-J185]|nr:hypothetical protein FV185_05900 [Ferrovum sp. PN-J185]